MRSPIFRALFQEQSPYFASLPFNLNWMPTERDILLSCSLPSPLTVVDVGCRGGIPGELWTVRKLIQHIGFDADQKECDRLASEPHELFSRSLFPIFVGGQDGELSFHLYKSPGDSSALKPDPRYTEIIGGPKFAIEKSIKVRTTKLDSFFASHPDLARPDMLKLDTQGTELEILRGGVKILETCCMVETEAEFISMYEGQPLFHDVMGFMLEQGFELFYLNRVFSQRRGFMGFAKGQMTFGDALFVRREDRLDGFDEDRLMRFVILLIVYGYLDCAGAIVAGGRLREADRVFVESYLRQRMGRFSTRQIKRAINPFIDKLILFLMYIRKHNSLAFDSDRSWPTR